ncbi:uncharacterized protein LOC119596181 [Penaeus monodon]|uniref:uncharacterized protein LOC119596181 n=1 Tax=Penaeus monodon TaxID=6687 RepID=UPI0018A74EEE|nr:uncharacterized protein LOC119596181 [Penaeus monodon]
MVMLSAGEVKLSFSPQDARRRAPARGRRDPARRTPAGKERGRSKEAARVKHVTAALLPRENANPGRNVRRKADTVRRENARTTKGKLDVDVKGRSATVARLIEVAKPRKYARSTRALARRPLAPATRGKSMGVAKAVGVIAAPLRK